MTLQRLVADGVPEERQLEYKSDWDLVTDRGKHAFLAEITAFANTAGGDLLVGVGEEQGRASALPGVLVADIDAMRARIDNLLHDQVEPALPPVEIEFPEVAPGRVVIAVRVRHSWSGPHRVRLNNQFYARRGNRRVPMEVPDLRAAFLLGEQLATRLQHLRDERLSLIETDETPIAVVSGPRAVVHLFPFDSLEPGRSVDLDLVRTPDHLGPVPYFQGFDTVWSLEGLTAFTSTLDGQRLGYVLAFRSGAIEFVLTPLLSRDNQRSFWPASVEAYVVGGTEKYLRTLDMLGSGYPMHASLSLLGCRSIRWGTSEPCRRDRIILPPAVLERPTSNIPALWRPSFEVLANAFGEARAAFWDAKQAEVLAREKAEGFIR